jgi:hypothetical protein
VSAAHAPDAGAEVSLRIGQRVRHRDYKGQRITGVVRGLSVDGEDVLHADIALDAAIVIPPLGDDDHELRIYRQHVPAHELAPFDEREELVTEMLAALRLAAEAMGGSTDPTLLGRADKAVRAAIAKATGGAA